MRKKLKNSNVAWVQQQQSSFIEDEGYCLSVIRLYIFFHLVPATRLPSLGISTSHFCADHLSMIGARQPCELNC